mmetsp:Transcript_5454/g.23167  ORF Transcript_5454/g.23167 Transcript_5454/m.23167 type:complete len:177 (-) Transcript_5454:988-1518(-)
MVQMSRHPAIPPTPLPQLSGASLSFASRTLLVGCDENRCGRLEAFGMMNSLEAGERTPISGNESMVLTHELRAMHEAILVGVNTVISDDPQLSVRLCTGSNPQPVVMDSSLRIPESCALMTSSTCKRPIIMTSRAVSSEKVIKLQALGATIRRCDANKDGRGLDLKSVLFNLRQYG